MIKVDISRKIKEFLCKRPRLPRADLPRQPNWCSFNVFPRIRKTPKRQSWAWCARNPCRILWFGVFRMRRNTVIIFLRARACMRVYYIIQHFGCRSATPRQKEKKRYFYGISLVSYQRDKPRKRLCHHRPGYTMVYGIKRCLTSRTETLSWSEAISPSLRLRSSPKMVTSFPSWVSAIVSILAAVVVRTVLGILIEGLAYKPLRAASSLAVLITAIGVSYLLQNSALLIWGSDPKTYSSVISGTLHLFDGKLSISYIAMFTILCCVVIMVALTLFTSKKQTRQGNARLFRRQRRCAVDGYQRQQNHFDDLCDRLRACRRCGSSAFCSSLLHPSPTTGSMPGIKAFTAAVFGGIGSIPGAFLGGLLLGVIESCCQGLHFNAAFERDSVRCSYSRTSCSSPGTLGKNVQEKV